MFLGALPAGIRLAHRCTRQAHVDDTYDQEGILLKPLAAAATQQPSGDDCPAGDGSRDEAEAPVGGTGSDTGPSRDETLALPAPEE
jgi:hypothetical protein